MAQKKPKMDINFDDIEKAVVEQATPAVTEQPSSAVSADTSNAVTEQSSSTVTPTPTTPPVKRTMQGTNIKLDAEVWERLHITCALNHLKKQDVIGAAIDYFIAHFHAENSNALNEEGYRLVKEYLKSIE